MQFKGYDFPAIRKPVEWLGNTGLFDLDSRWTNLPQVAPWTTLSEAFGLYDSAYLHSKKINPFRAQLFSKGYGDLAASDELREWAIETVVNGQASNTLPKVVTFSKQRHTTHGDADQYGAMQISEADFMSPAARYLPYKSKRASFMVVEPTEDSSYPATRAIAIHLPATGDETYNYRRTNIAEPLLREGITSILMTAPFYGERRPPGQRNWFVQTVAESINQSTAVVLEAMQVVAWARKTFPDTPICLTGFSWGGSMAACAAAGISGGDPIALCPCMATNSPQAIVTGVISLNIDWDSLIHDGKHHSKAEAQMRLLDILGAYDLDTVIAANPSPVLKSVVQLSAHNDWFVQKRYGQSLYDSLADLTRHPTLGEVAEMTWLPGGHATSFFSSPFTFAPAIVRSINQLDAAAKNLTLDQPQAQTA